MPAVEAELAKAGVGVGVGVTAAEVQDEAVRRFLPCERCRGAEACAQRIAGTRLGATERQLLLQLPAPHTTPGVPIAEGADRSTREAGKRAMRKLFGLGLVDTDMQRISRAVRASESSVSGQRFHRSYRFVTASLSDYGAALVALIRSELEAGERVRWGERPVEALRAVRKTGPKLVERLANRASEFAAKMRSLGGGLDSSVRRSDVIVRAAAKARGRRRKA